MSSGLSVLTSVCRGSAYLDGFFANLRSLEVPRDCEFQVAVVGQEGEEDYERFSAFAREFQSRITVHRVTDHENLPSTWNRLVKAAHFSNFTIWNIDDRRSVDSLAVTLDQVRDADYSVAYGSFVIRTMKFGRERSALITARALPDARDIRGMPFGPFMTFSRSAHAAVGGFDEQFDIAADFDFGLRAALSAPTKLIKATLGEFLNRGAGLSTRSRGRFLTERTAVQLRHVHGAEISPFYLRSALSFHAEHALQGGSLRSLKDIDPIFWEVREERLRGSKEQIERFQAGRSLLNLLYDRLR